MAIQDLRKTCDRQNLRHPDLVSRRAGELIRLRAIERDIQDELEPWQRRHTEPPAEPPPRRTTWRPRGGYTRELLKCCKGGARVFIDKRGMPWWSGTGHDHWPVRP